MGVLREMAEKLGHKVLPLALYSPELNPIEKVWANIKRYLRIVLSDYARFDDAHCPIFILIYYNIEADGQGWRGSAGVFQFFHNGVRFQTTFGF